MDVSRFDSNMAIRQADENGLVWYQPHEAPFKLMGFNWFEQDRVYRRLPVTPAIPLPEAVNELAWCTTGGQVKFRTDSGKVSLKATLRDAGAMDHMAYTGMSGFDLYIGEPGLETFYAVTRFACGATEFSSDLFDTSVFDCGPRQMRTFTLNFPLYKGVNELAIGLQEGAALALPPAYQADGPVVVYGTSTTQGGCASRPGTCWTNILSRRLNRPFLNLGFSGSGRGEPDVARILARIESPALFVLDYESNCHEYEALKKSLPVFIAILRERHERVPILVISMIRFGKEARVRQLLTDREQRRGLQQEHVEALRQAGDPHVHFLDGSGLLGEDYWECTVDGCHPTDLGFMRMADGIEPALRKILAR